MTVIIMRGMPGAGKTTEAQRWASLSSDYTIVSADDYMFAGGQSFDHHRLERCHEQCKVDFEAALKRGGKLVIADNTNTKFADLVPYVELAEAYGRDFIVLQVHISPKLAFERNKHGVPLETLQLLGRRIWSERLPSTWNVWNKGIPWKPHNPQDGRKQPAFRHSWKPYFVGGERLGEQCPKCLIIRIAQKRQRAARPGAKVVTDFTRHYEYYTSAGIVGAGIHQQPECIK